MNVAAVNWPHSRGTAVAFPMAGYGLSAFFFSVLSHLAFPDDTSGLLLLLAIATTSMIIVGGLFLRIIPRSATDGERISHTEMNDLKLSLRADPAEGRGLLNDANEPGAPSGSISVDTYAPKTDGHPQDGDSEEVHSDKEDVMSLLSDTSSGHVEENQFASVKKGDGVNDDDLRNLDIRGFRLLKITKFWQIWLILGLLTGIGLMTIK